MKTLLSIDRIVGHSIRDAIYASQEYHDTPMDIVQSIVSLHTDVAGIYTSGDVVGSKSSWRTVVKERPSWLDSLGMFYDLFLSGTGERINAGALTNWKPRERISFTGTTYPGLELVSRLTSEFHSCDDYDVNNVPLFVFNDGVNAHLSADQFFEWGKLFATTAVNKRLVTRVPFRNNSGNVGAAGLAHYYELHCTDDLFTGTVNLTSWWWPGYFLGFSWWFLSDTSYTFSVRRDPVLPHLLIYSATAGDGDAFYGSEIYGVRYQPFFQYNWGLWQNPFTVRAVDQHISYAGITPLLRQMASAIPVSIMRCVPGLFYTQSRAYNTLIGKVTRNFESLMKSSDFIPSLIQGAESILALKGTAVEATEKRVTKRLFESLSSITVFEDYIPLFDRVRALVQLIAAIDLTFAFALEPALRTASNVLDSTMRNVLETEGVGAMAFSGKDITALPESLRLLLSSFRDERILSYDVHFRTEMTSRVSHGNFYAAVDRLLRDAGALGFEPDPIYLYKMIPFTFVFEWFVPVTAMLNAAYVRYKMVGNSSLTVGHSVSILITYASGFKTHVYLRSEPTRLYLDPPSDSWLTSPGVPIAVAVPLAIVVLF